MPNPALPSAEECERIFHAALDNADMKAVEAALFVLAVQDPRRAEKLMQKARTALGIVDAADSGRYGFDRADLREWMEGEPDAD